VVVVAGSVVLEGLKVTEMFGDIGITVPFPVLK
jgi:hypothetical protein